MMESFQFCSSVLAQAQGQDIGVYVVNTFKNAIQGYGPPIIIIAERLFWSLALISLVWTGVTMILKKGDAMDFLSEFVKYSIALGFFYWLLTNSTTMASSIIDGLATASEQVSSTSNGIKNGNTIFQQAQDVSWFAASQISILDPKMAFIWALIAIISLILGCYILVVVISAFCAGAMLAYAGIFVLGFGGSRWTSDIAITFYKAVIAAGLKIFTLNLLAQAAITVVQQTVYQNKNDLAGAMTCLAILVIVALLLSQVPDLIAGLVYGATFRSPGSATGSIVATAGFAAAATGLAGQAIGRAAQKIASPIENAIKRANANSNK